MNSGMGRPTAAPIQVQLFGEYAKGRKASPMTTMNRFGRFRQRLTRAFRDSMKRLTVLAATKAMRRCRIGGAPYPASFGAYLSGLPLPGGYHLLNCDPPLDFTLRSTAYRSVVRSLKTLSRRVKKPCSLAPFWLHPKGAYPIVCVCLRDIGRVWHPTPQM